MSDPDKTEKPHTHDHVDPEAGADRHGVNTDGDMMHGRLDDEDEEVDP